MGVHSEFAIERFVAYTGFVRRDCIARQADDEITSFEELATMALGWRGSRLSFRTRRMQDDRLLGAR
jgi:hypothetical protein